MCRLPLFRSEAPALTHLRTRCPPCASGMGAVVGLRLAQESSPGKIAGVVSISGAWANPPSSLPLPRFVRSLGAAFGSMFFPKLPVVRCCVFFLFCVVVTPKKRWGKQGVASCRLCFLDEAYAGALNPFHAIVWWPLIATTAGRGGLLGHVRRRCRFDSGRTGQKRGGGVVGGNGHSECRRCRAVFMLTL